MHNLMIVFTFCLLFTGIYLFFLSKFGRKNQNCHLKLKFGISINSNMQNWKATLTFSVWDLNYPFWKKLLQKIKIVRLRWNLLARLIWICRTLRQCSHFTIFNRNHPFRANLVQKTKFGTCSNLDIQNFMVMLTRSISTRNIFLG